MEIKGNEKVHMTTFHESLYKASNTLNRGIDNVHIRYYLNDEYFRDGNIDSNKMYRDLNLETTTTDALAQIRGNFSARHESEMIERVAAAARDVEVRTTSNYQTKLAKKFAKI